MATDQYPADERRPLGRPGVEASLAPRGNETYRTTEERQEARRWFVPRTLHSIVLEAVPPEERPLRPVDAQRIEWIQQQIDQRPGEDHKARYEELDRLNERPLTGKVLVDRIRRDWKEPPLPATWAKLTWLAAGYVRSWMALQTWPLWVDAQIKDQVRQELIKRLIWELSLHTTSDYHELTYSIQESAMRALSPYYRRMAGQRAIRRMPGLKRQLQVGASALVAGFAYVTAVSGGRGFRMQQARYFPLMAPPSEALDWQTFRDRDGHAMLAELVRLDVYGEELVFELSPAWHRQQGQAYMARWADPDAIANLVGGPDVPHDVWAFRPRSASQRLGILTLHHSDAQLDELPRKMASTSWSAHTRVGRLATHSAAQAERTMGRHRYPDMDTDEVRFLWLRERLFGALGVPPTRRVRVAPGVPAGAVEPMRARDYDTDKLRALRPEERERYGAALTDVLTMNLYMNHGGVCGVDVSHLSLPWKKERKHTPFGRGQRVSKVLWRQRLHVRAKERRAELRARMENRVDNALKLQEAHVGKGPREVSDVGTATVAHGYRRQMERLQAKLRQAYEERARLQAATGLRPAQGPRPIGWGDARPERGVGDRMVGAIHGFRDPSEFTRTTGVDESTPPRWRDQLVPRNTAEAGEGTSFHRHLLISDLAHVMAEEKLLLDRQFDTTLRPLRPRRRFTRGPRVSARALHALRGDIRRKLTTRMDQMVVGLTGDPLSEPTVLNQGEELDGTEPSMASPSHVPGEPLSSDSLLDYFVGMWAKHMVICLKQLDKLDRAAVTFNHHIPLEELMLRPLGIRRIRGAKIMRFPKMAITDPADPLVFDRSGSRDIGVQPGNEMGLHQIFPYACADEEMAEWAGVGEEWVDDLRGVRPPTTVAYGNAQIGVQKDDMFVQFLPREELEQTVRRGARAREMRHVRMYERQKITAKGRDYGPRLPYVLGMGYLTELFDKEYDRLRKDALAIVRTNSTWRVTPITEETRDAFGPMLQAFAPAGWQSGVWAGPGPTGPELHARRMANQQYIWDLEDALDATHARLEVLEDTALGLHNLSLMTLGQVRRSPARAVVTEVTDMAGRYIPPVAPVRSISRDFVQAWASDPLKRNAWREGREIFWHAMYGGGEERERLDRVMATGLEHRMIRKKRRAKWKFHIMGSVAQDARAHMDELLANTQAVLEHMPLVQALDTPGVHTGTIRRLAALSDVLGALPPSSEKNLEGLPTRLALAENHAWQTMAEGVIDQVTDLSHRLQWAIKHARTRTGRPSHRMRDEYRTRLEKVLEVRVRVCKWLELLQTHGEALESKAYAIEIARARRAHRENVRGRLGHPEAPGAVDDRHMKTIFESIPLMPWSLREDGWVMMVGPTAWMRDYWPELYRIWYELTLPQLETMHVRALDRAHANATPHWMQQEIVRWLGQDGSDRLAQARYLVVRERRLTGDARLPKMEKYNWKLRQRRMSQRRHRWQHRIDASTKKRLPARVTSCWSSARKKRALRAKAHAKDRRDLGTGSSWYRSVDPILQDIPDAKMQLIGLKSKRYAKLLPPLAMTEADATHIIDKRVRLHEEKLWLREFTALETISEMINSSFRHGDRKTILLNNPKVRKIVSMALINGWSPDDAVHTMGTIRKDIFHQAARNLCDCDECSLPASIPSFVRWAVNKRIIPRTDKPVNDGIRPLLSINDINESSRSRDRHTVIHPMDRGKKGPFLPWNWVKFWSQYRYVHASRRLSKAWILRWEQSQRMEFEPLGLRWAPRRSMQRQLAHYARNGTGTLVGLDPFHPKTCQRLLRRDAQDHVHEELDGGTSLGDNVDPYGYDGLLYERTFMLRYQPWYWIPVAKITPMRSTMSANHFNVSLDTPGPVESMAPMSEAYELGLQAPVTTKYMKRIMGQVDLRPEDDPKELGKAILKGARAWRARVLAKMVALDTKLNWNTPTSVRKVFGDKPPGPIAIDWGWERTSGHVYAHRRFLGRLHLGSKRAWAHMFDTQLATGLTTQLRQQYGEGTTDDFLGGPKGFTIRASTAKKVARWKGRQLVGETIQWANVDRSQLEARLWERELFKRSNLMIRNQLERRVEALKKRWWGLAAHPVPRVVARKRAELGRRLVNALTVLDLQRTQEQILPVEWGVCASVPSVLARALGPHGTQVVRGGDGKVVIHPWGASGRAPLGGWGTREPWHGHEPWRIMSRMNTSQLWMETLQERLVVNRTRRPKVRQKAPDTVVGVTSAKYPVAGIARGSLSSRFEASWVHRRKARIKAALLSPYRHKRKQDKIRARPLRGISRIRRLPVERPAWGPGGVDSSELVYQDVSDGLRKRSRPRLTRTVLGVIKRIDKRERAVGKIRRIKRYQRARRIASGYDRIARSVHRRSVRAVRAFHRQTTSTLKWWNREYVSRSGDGAMWYLLTRRRGRDVRENWGRLGAIDVTSYLTCYALFQCMVTMRMIMRPLLNRMKVLTLTKRERNSYKWDINYLDEKGSNNKRRLSDLIGLGETEMEMHVLAFVLRQRGLAPWIKLFYWLARVPLPSTQAGDEELVLHNPHTHNVRFWPDSARRMARINRLIGHAPSVWARLPKYQSRQETGALFTGPPGTGKTMLAQAMAGSAGLRFLGLCASEFMIRGRKDSANLIRGFFHYARTQTPCIVFIDEVDSISLVRPGMEEEYNLPPHRVTSQRKQILTPEWEPAQPRTRHLEHKDFWRLPRLFPLEPYDLGWSARHSGRRHWLGHDVGMRSNKGVRQHAWEDISMLVQLLCELDSCRRRGQMFVIGATNRRELMDPAVLRDGRIDRAVYLGRPSLSKRLQILKHYMGGCAISERLPMVYALAMTLDMSAADIATLANESHIRAVFDGTFAHTEETMERGMSVVSSILSDDDEALVGEAAFIKHDPLLWSRTAYYRAGRSIVLYTMPGQRFVASCLTHRRGRGKRRNPIQEWVERPNIDSAQPIVRAKKSMVVHLAGRAGQLIAIQDSLPGRPGVASAQAMASLELRRHVWDTEMATAFACRIVDNWNHFDRRIGMARGQGRTVNQGAMRRRSWLEADTWCEILGADFREQETSRYMEMPPEQRIMAGSTSYMPLLPAWWSHMAEWKVGLSNTQMGFDVIDENPSAVNMAAWPLSYYKDAGLQTNWDYYEGEGAYYNEPVQRQLQYEVQTLAWSPDHRYRTMRDMQVTRLLRGASQFAWQIIQEQRSALDMCAALILGQGIVRMHELDQILRPLRSPMDYLDVGSFLRTVAWPSKVRMRRVERCWMTKADRFAHRPHERNYATAAMGITVVQRTVAPRRFVPINRAAEFIMRPPSVLSMRHQALMRAVTLLNEQRATCVPRYDAMCADMQAVHTALDTVVRLVEQLDPGLTRRMEDTWDATRSPSRGMTATAEQVLRPLLGDVVSPPTPALCLPKHTFPSLQPRVPDQLDSWLVPVRQLQQLAGRLLYVSALHPLTESVHSWMTRWHQGDMHVSQLLWMLMPLDQPWHVDDIHTVHEELCAEPHRALWLLTYRPSELLWGQSPNLERVQAWVNLCEGIHRGMETRMASMSPMTRDVFDERARASLAAPPVPELRSLDLPSQLFGFMESWSLHMHRSSMAMDSLATHLSGAPSAELLAALHELADARQQAINHIPSVRDMICNELTNSVKVYALSVGLARSVCSYAAAEFADAEQQRSA